MLSPLLAAATACFMVLYCSFLPTFKVFENAKIGKNKSRSLYILFLFFAYQMELWLLNDCSSKFCCCFFCCCFIFIRLGISSHRTFNASSLHEGCCAAIEESSGREVCNIFVCIFSDFFIGSRIIIHSADVVKFIIPSFFGDQLCSILSFCDGHFAIFTLVFPRCDFFGSAFGTSCKKNCGCAGY